MLYCIYAYLFTLKSESNRTAKHDYDNIMLQMYNRQP